LFLFYNNINQKRGLRKIKKFSSTPIDFLFLTLMLLMLVSKVVPDAAASVSCHSTLELRGSVNDSVPPLRCYKLSVGYDINFLRIDLEPRSPRVNLDFYFNDTGANFLSDWDQINAGTITNQVIYAISSPDPGTYTIGVVPVEGSGGKFSLSVTQIKAASLGSHQPRTSCSGEVCSRTYPIRTRSLELGPRFGDRIIFPLKINRPGQVKVRVKWQGTAQRLALILNGPDRPKLSNPVAYYARQDGGSPLSIVYNLTHEDIRRGSKWRVSLVNFSGGYARDGQVDITYPSGGERDSTAFLARLDNFVGNWKNVDRATRGITRINISRVGSRLQVHTWGACHTTDCDHGATTVVFRGNPIVIRRDLGFKQEILTLALLKNGKLRALSDNIFSDGTRRDYVSEYQFYRARQTLTAPNQLSPNAGAIFNHYPRRTTLQWSAIPGAKSYTVEIDCFHCCQSGRWCSDVGGRTTVVRNLTRPTYTFSFVGAQPGRWRVWAVDVTGRKGPKSPWRQFRYTR